MRNRVALPKVPPEDQGSLIRIKSIGDFPRQNRRFTLARHQECGTKPHRSIAFYD